MSHPISGSAERDSLAAELVATLIERDLTLATCESLTGGLVGATITSVPGASKVYRGGLITYHRDLKVSLAGVDADSAATYGVVTEQTAAVMARGALRTCEADLAVSCTGVAGPEPLEDQPPGTVWIALAMHQVGTEVAVFTELLTLAGDRAQVRDACVHHLLQLVLRVLSPVD